MKIEDPYSYLSPEYDKKYQSRLSIPKYIINSSGDDFFVPDSSKFYFNKLPGNQNYIRYLPNSMHYLSGNPISDALGNQKKVDDAISTFYIGSFPLDFFAKPFDRKIQRIGTYL